MIGYLMLRDRPLSPPDPTVTCRICECHVYSYDQLENGLCDTCVEEYVCIECGREVQENENTNRYGYCPECEHENA